MKINKQQIAHYVKVFLGLCAFLLVMTGMNDHNVDLIWSLF